MVILVVVVVVVVVVLVVVVVEEPVACGPGTCPQGADRRGRRPRGARRGLPAPPGTASTRRHLAPPRHLHLAPPAPRTSSALLAPPAPLLLTSHKLHHASRAPHFLIPSPPHLLTPSPPHPLTSSPPAPPHPLTSPLLTPGWHQGQGYDPRGAARQAQVGGQAILPLDFLIKRLFFFWIY